MSVQEMNRNILAALQAAVDLPDRITDLTLSVGVNKVPELTITTIILSKTTDQKPERLEVTKRYRLAEIPVDVTTLSSHAKEFA